jgi:hypothetical protein
VLTATDVLIAFAIVAAWLLSVWVKPFGRCWRCHGKRVVMKGGSKPKRPASGKRKPKPAKPVTCRVCKGVGRRQRTGSPSSTDWLAASAAS